MDKFNFIAKVLDTFSGLTIGKMISLFIIAMLGYLIFITTPTIKSYIDYQATVYQTESAVPSKPYMSKMSEENIKTILDDFIKDDPDIAMILFYSFVPDKATFFQGRRLMVYSINPSTNLHVEKYRLDWIPISALKQESDLILKGSMFEADIKQIYTQYLTADDQEIVDEYASPIDFRSINVDGGKCLKSIPVRTYRIVGNVTVYYRTLPTDINQDNKRKNIGKSIASALASYISD